MNNLTTMANVSNEKIMELIHRARELENDAPTDLKKTYTVSNLFFEPSTRTKLSFEMAERKLGCHVLPFEVETSSVQKGETLLDTVKTLEAIGVDAVVIRHEQPAYFEQLIESGTIPIINGGDGIGHHPTQSLLDLKTIFDEFHSFQELEIVIAGDIDHSRVARSNAEALTRLGARVSFVGPREWCLSTKTNNWEDVIEKADVVMLLRVQHERHDSNVSFEKKEYHERYGLTLERFSQMKPSAIIMHPAPVNRGVEIADELVEHERSRIFKQMQNGVYMRMAILETILKERS